MQSRNKSLDVCKGLGIVSVVLGHNALTRDAPELSRAIFSFHMPLFFVLAGVFLPQGSWSLDFLRKKADSLLKPFAVVMVTGLVLRLVFSMGKGLSNAPAWAVANALWATSATLVWQSLWFLPHLFLALCAALAVSSAMPKATLRGSWAVASALLALGSACVGAFWAPPLPVSGTADLAAAIRQGQWPGLPWSIELLPVSVALLLLGQRHAARLRRFEPDARWLGASLLGFAVLHLAFDGALDLANRQIEQPLVAWPKAALGVCLTLGTAAWLTRRMPFIADVLARLGEASLFILMFHGPVQSRAFMAALGAMPQTPLVAFGLSFLVGVCVPWAFWEVASRVALLGRWLLPVRGSQAGRPGASV